MKIKKLRLYKEAIVEKNGDFELEVSEIEEVPCLVTNKALQVCRQLGVTETSLAEDFNLVLRNSDKDGTVRKMPDDKLMLQAIYVGYVGGQLLLGKDMPKYDYDEFLTRYHESVNDRWNTYIGLFMTEENKFVEGIVKSTKKTVGKDEKK